MLAPAISVYRFSEREVRRIVARDDALRLLGRDDCLRPARFLLRIDLPTVVEGLALARLEAALRIGGRAASLVRSAVVAGDGLKAHTENLYSIGPVVQRRLGTLSLQTHHLHCASEQRAAGRGQAVENGEVVVLRADEIVFDHRLPLFAEQLVLLMETLLLLAAHRRIQRGIGRG